MAEAPTNPEDDEPGDAGLPGEREPERTGEPWQPKRGVVFKTIAWLLLLLILFFFVSMVVLLLWGGPHAEGAPKADLLLNSPR